MKNVLNQLDFQKSVIREEIMEELREKEHSEIQRSQKFKKGANKKWVYQSRRIY